MSQPLATASGSLMTPGHLLHLTGVMAAGGGLYLTLGLVFKVEEIRTLSLMVRQRVQRKR